MAKKRIEFSVGIFLIVGCACAFWLLAEVGGVRFKQDNRYSLSAYFTSVSGLKKGAIIEMAGVQIGSVSAIELDTTRYLARITLKVDNNIELSDDTIASVKTAGIIGDKYINLLPGGSEEILAEGDAIYSTESSLDLESLVSKYIFGQDNDEN